MGVAILLCVVVLALLASLIIFAPDGYQDSEGFHYSKPMLFLDDERSPADVTWIKLPQGTWDIVRNQSEFEDYVLKNGIPDHISFDNDLGTNMGEGIWCAQWIVDQVLDGNVKWNPTFSFTVHSKNNIAASRINSLLNNFIQHMA